MNVEYAIPFSLVTPMGTLDLNDDDGRNLDFRYLIDGTQCLMGPAALRTTVDDVPQGDGGLPHRSFRSYQLAKLHLQFWYGTDNESAVRACGWQVREMWDYLMLHLNSLVRPETIDADTGLTRLLWTPGNGGTIAIDDRMLNRVTVHLWPIPIVDDQGFVECDFTLLSPFPYAMDVNEISTDLSGSDATVVNEGSSDFYPVFRIDGPCTQFTITNDTTGLAIVFDSAMLGGTGVSGGEYAEIDTFKNTIFLNGNSSNLKESIDFTATDFFPLVPGENVIVLSGGASTGQMLWQNAWV